MKGDYADAYVNRGVVRGLKGDLHGAVADIRKGAEIDPKSVSDSNRGNFSTPLLELNQFITNNPSDARAYVMRGILKLFQRKEIEATNDFKKSLELEPKLKTAIDRITQELKSDQ